MHLEKIKKTHFKEGEKYTFVIPTGSTEQHGPFLPIGTDSYIQDKIIQEGEKKFQDVIFLPTLRITCSEEHEGFAGSVWISKATMMSVIKDICNSIKPYAKQIIFMTAHGGNIEVLNEFIDQNKSKHKDIQLNYLEPFTPEVEKQMVDLIEGPLDDHAGNTEISMMLAIDEDLVAEPASDYPKKKIEGPFKTGRLADVSEDGVADNHPEWKFSKKLGDELIAITVKGFIKELKKILI